MQCELCMGLFSALLNSTTEPGNQVVAISVFPRSRKKVGNTDFIQINSIGVIMRKITNMEILLPTWEGNTGERYWGDYSYESHDNETTSLWLSLRGLVPGDPYSYMQDECRAVNDIGLYVWISVNGAISIDLRLRECSSLSLRETELRIKALKRLFVIGKAYQFSSFVRDSDVHAEITKALDAIRVKRTMVYHGTGISETYQPVGIAIKRISETIEERLEQMRLCQVA